MGILDKLFGTRSEREVKRLLPTVDKIEALSDEYAALSDEALRAKTEEFKARYQSGETLDDLLPDALFRDVITDQILHTADTALRKSSLANWRIQLRIHSRGDRPSYSRQGRCIYVS